MERNEDIYKVKQLVKELNIHRDSYYNKNSPTISDREYDALYDELKDLEFKTSLLLANSPTQTVGFTVVSKLNKVEHKSPLLSMDKTKSISDMIKFMNSKEVLVMAKADGLTTELIYEFGELVQASTRGNGEIGEDITHNVKTFKNIPLQIPYKGYLRLVGESLILDKDFREINRNIRSEGGVPYKNSRNLTSGSVRQLDSALCSERNVRFFAFGLLEESTHNFKEKMSQLLFLEGLGFSIIPHRFTEDKNKLESEINRMKSKSIQYGFPIDGVVVSFNNVAYSKSLGRTGHHYLDGMAYKFEDETELTTLTEIEWSVGKTGAITPVAIFDTVVLDGTEVSRASLHNISIMKALKLGIGDEISVYKANMIIPQILKNNTNSNNIKVPEFCPSCGKPTTEETLNSSTVLKCTNPYCTQQLIGRFSHFCSRDAMNIDGLSESTIEKFINMGLLKRFIDIYQLSLFYSKIVDMEGFGEKSYEKLINAINKSKNVKMENFIYALGINNIGRNSSKQIAKYFHNNIDDFFLALNNKFDFSVIDDFGDITNDSIYEWHNSPFERDLNIALGTVIKVEKPEKKDLGFKSLNDLTFVVTGSIITYKNRNEIEDLIVQLGGKTSGSVSKNTSFLINNDTTSTSGKNQKAKEVGVKIISEEEFNKMIGRVV